MRWCGLASLLSMAAEWVLHFYGDSLSQRWMMPLLRRAAALLVPMRGRHYLRLSNELSCPSWACTTTTSAVLCPGHTLPLSAVGVTWWMSSCNCDCKYPVHLDIG